jgi:hypothetical protein
MMCEHGLATLQVVVMLLRQAAQQALESEVLKTGQYAAIESNVRDTQKAASDAIRIKSQPVPHGLSLMCSGFVQASLRTRNVLSHVVETIRLARLFSLLYCSSC